jgi:hypothetical protein
MLFVEMPAFSRLITFTDDELRAVQSMLVDNPEAGDLIPGGRGLRKLRAALSGRGKRGGGAGDLLLVGKKNRLLPGVYLPKIRDG